MQGGLEMCVCVRARESICALLTLLAARACVLQERLGWLKLV